MGREAVALTVALVTCSAGRGPGTSEGGDHVTARCRSALGQLYEPKREHLPEAMS
jgi:hypothetical protein